MESERAGAHLVTNDSERNPVWNRAEDQYLNEQQPWLFGVERQILWVAFVLRKDGEKWTMVVDDRGEEKRTKISQAQ